MTFSVEIRNIKVPYDVDSDVVDSFLAANM